MDTFQLSGTVRLNQPEGKRFRFLANSGKPFPHSYGQTIVDLASIRVSRPNLPILLDHDTSRRVGFTESAKVVPEGFVVEGRFIDSAEAQDVLRQAKSGFPWEVSISIDQIEHERIRESESMRVNGELHHGPMMILRNGNLREVSFVAVAADQSTSAVLLRKSSPDNLRSEWDGLSLADRGEFWDSFDEFQQARTSGLAAARHKRGPSGAELRYRWSQMTEAQKGEFWCDFDEFCKSRGGR